LTTYSNKPRPDEGRTKVAASGFKKAASAFGGNTFSSNTIYSSDQNPFSAEFGPDYFEMPQTEADKLRHYRLYYATDEIVGQSIDLHTELPLSRVRLTQPKPRTHPKRFDSPEAYGKYIHRWFERWCKRVNLTQHLLSLVHHYWRDNGCVPFAEDHSPPASAAQSPAALKKFYDKEYKGWEKIIILTRDAVEVRRLSFSDYEVTYVPSKEDRASLERQDGADPLAAELQDAYSEEVRDYLARGEKIPLGTDPAEGSFAYVFSGRKGADRDDHHGVFGSSILDRCMKTLTYREKLRQAQTSIASRAMTPHRIVSAEGLGPEQLEELRVQVDQALLDPDASIVTNYPVTWEEMGARDRLLDLGIEYEQSERRLITGLGVTESLLSGESLFSSERFKLQIIEQRYLFLREAVQRYVEQYLFEPMARRKGFIDTDEFGDEVVLHPSLSFTRLPLRDNQELADILMQLYLKGSVPVEYILELLNIDAHDAKLKLEDDLMTVNDAGFNNVLGGLYSEMGRTLLERTDAVDRAAKSLNLKLKPEEEGGEDAGF
jgi:hypothetical protein